MLFRTRLLEIEVSARSIYVRLGTRDWFTTLG